MLRWLVVDLVFVMYEVIVRTLHHVTKLYYSLGFIQEELPTLGIEEGRHVTFSNRFTSLP